jgi:hypothetical protein
MKYLVPIILAAIVANLVLYWDTSAVYGWVVALAGWLPHLFDKKEQHGN